MSWQYEALCAQADPELFFPELKGSSYEVARRICQACPVIDQCRAYGDEIENFAVHMTGTFGFIGGESRKERIARRRKEQTARKEQTRCPTLK